MGIEFRINVDAEEGEALIAVLEANGVEPGCFFGGLFHYPEIAGKVCHLVIEKVLQAAALKRAGAEEGEEERVTKVQIEK